jgi:dTDP-4-amino-4,6-dideoxygalactose transaminase
LVAAFLWGQLEEANRITKERLSIWRRYHKLLEPLEDKGMLRRPIIPDDCEHNAHMYYIILAPEIDRQKVLDSFRLNEIGAVFHYVSLHSSPAGRHYGRVYGDLNVTNRQSNGLVRLPLWIGLSNEQQDRIVKVLSDF